MERDIDDVTSDAAWNRGVRDETPIERLDRNWGDLLQELRVVQTGVQLLTGLLLTVPFQSRFDDLSGSQRVLYLVTLSLSAAATGLLIAPVAAHRVLFRQHARATLVSWGQRSAIGGLALLGLAVTGVIVLIFDVVAGQTPSIIAGSVCGVVFAALWAVIPLILRARP
jgi:hypothetical protein